jgi:hypothetical protein
MSPALDAPAKGRTRLFVNRVYGIRPMEQIIAGMTGVPTPESEEPQWIEIVRKKKGVYEIVNDNFTSEIGKPPEERNFINGTGIGLEPADEEVEVFDTDFWGVESHLKWHDVEFNLGDDNRIYAPSINRIREAIKHIDFVAFCPGDE